jgi:hypothetical protein
MPSIGRRLPVRRFLVCGCEAHRPLISLTVMAVFASGGRMVTRQEPSRSVFVWWLLTLLRARASSWLEHFRHASMSSRTYFPQPYRRSTMSRENSGKDSRSSSARTHSPSSFRPTAAARGLWMPRHHQHAHLNFGECRVESPARGLGHRAKNLWSVGHAPPGPVDSAKAESFVERTLVENWVGQRPEDVLHEPAERFEPDALPSLRE